MGLISFLFGSEPKPEGRWVIERGGKYWNESGWGSRKWAKVIHGNGWDYVDERWPDDEDISLEGVTGL